MWSPKTASALSESMASSSTFGALTKPPYQGDLARGHPSRTPCPPNRAPAPLEHLRHDDQDQRVTRRTTATAVLALVAGTSIPVHAGDRKPPKVSKAVMD